MAKVKVHELAKELNIKSKDIIEALKGSNYEVKSANSSLDDDGIAVVHKKFKANAKNQGEVKAVIKNDAKADERPKKAL